MSEVTEEQKKVAYKSYLNNYLALGMSLIDAEKAAETATKFHFKKEI